MNTLVQSAINALRVAGLDNRASNVKTSADVADIVNDFGDIIDALHEAGIACTDVQDAAGAVLSEAQWAALSAARDACVAARDSVKRAA